MCTLTGQAGRMATVGQRWLLSLFAPIRQRWLLSLFAPIHQPHSSEVASDLVQPRARDGHRPAQAPQSWAGPTDGSEEGLTFSGD